MKHTKGPWRTGETRDNYDCVIRSADNSPVALVLLGGYTKQTGEAHCHLIAAAPELLEVIEMLLKEVITERDCFYDGCSDSEGIIADEDDKRSLVDIDVKIDKAQAVINKVKGDL